MIDVIHKKMDYVICISGQGGGNQGPRGLYQKLDKFLSSYKVICFDTIPKNIDENILSLTNLIYELENINSISFIGWSKGGATTIKIAHICEQILKIKLKIIVLLASQTRDTELISKIQTPIVFIHGTNDNCLSCTCSKKLYTKCKSEKKLILIEGDHGLYEDVNKTIEIITDLFTSNLYPC